VKNWPINVELQVKLKITEMNNDQKDVSVYIERKKKHAEVRKLPRSKGASLLIKKG